MIRRYLLLTLTLAMGIAACRPATPPALETVEGATATPTPVVEEITPQVTETVEAATPTPEKTPSPEVATPQATAEPDLGFASHFGFTPAFLDFQAAREAGARWDRPPFDLFGWFVIEPRKGVFKWMMPDSYIKEAQSYGLHILANIQPFVDWDQKLCHQDLPKAPGLVEPMGPRPPETKGKPCDMEAYASFVRALVERYDGDGVDDMPGLKYPIKYWEVANEPEMQEPPLVFFQGSPEDYLELLKVTYQAIKEADPEAKVVQGGMAGMDDFMVEFWEPILASGGGEYFDIANIHSIDHGEHLNLPEFKAFLAKHGLEKPIWVTEVEFGLHTAKENSPEELARVLARSYVYALANGAEKLFYVQLKMPKHLPPKKEGGPDFIEAAALITADGHKQPIYFAHQTVARKLGRFQSVEKLKEKVKGTRILKGQYKFIVEGRPVYVLWGSGPLPEEIKGRVKVTDFLGREEIKDASQVTLSESPVYVEFVE